MNLFQLRPGSLELNLWLSRGRATNLTACALLVGLVWPSELKDPQGCHGPGHFGCLYSRSSIWVFIDEADMNTSPTARGSEKRLGPALPGLNKIVLPRAASYGRCEWPKITMSGPRRSSTCRSFLPI